MYNRLMNGSACINLLWFHNHENIRSEYPKFLNMINNFLKSSDFQHNTQHSRLSYFQKCKKEGNMIKCHTSSEAIGIYVANEVSIIINSVSLLYSAVSCSLYVVRASLVAQPVKSPPAKQETWVQSWVGKIPWRRERLPTLEYQPGEFQRCCKESDTTE